MAVSNTYVRARIDPRTKARAVSSLSAMGLSVSDAIRILLFRIAEERKLPFEIKEPNKLTIEAIEELESGRGVKSNNINDLMAKLHENN